MAQSYPELTASVTRIRGASQSAIVALNGVSARINEAVAKAVADESVTKAELAAAVTAETAALDEESTNLAAAVVAPGL